MLLHVAHTYYTMRLAAEWIDNEKYLFLLSLLMSSQTTYIYSEVKSTVEWTSPEKHSFSALILDVVESCTYLL